MEEQAVVPGIKGVCPDCGEAVLLTLNPKLQKPALRPKIEKLIEDQGLGERGQYWTVRHSHLKQGNRRAGLCCGGLCPASLTRQT